MTEKKAGSSSRFAMMVAYIVGLLLFTSGVAIAEPSKSQVTKMWEDQHHVKGRVLDIKSMGGQRTTNELHGKHYLTPVATCWNYDIVELQKCGCRLFIKSSACCRKGSSQDCELRIGNSKMVDCTPYKKPKFGLSGNTEPSECKSQRMATSCWNRKDLVLGAGSVIGPCREKSPSFTCPNGWNTGHDFLNKKCGPTPEDCGCVLVEECSPEEGLKCYKAWRSNKAGLACYTNPANRTEYDKEKCYKAVSGEGIRKSAQEGASDATDAAVDRLKKLW